MHALLIGATGATGRDLLDLLLKDNDFEQVDVFARRPFDIHHPKLQVHVIDFDKPWDWKHLIKADVLFSCLGTTLKTAGSKDAQWKVDYDYQYEFAKAARENQVTKLVLVSSNNAAVSSSFFYARMKGQLEEAVKLLGFPSLVIFNPPVLIRKNSDRTLEVLGWKVIKLFNKVGFLLSQKPLPTEVLARAMVSAAKGTSTGLQIIKGREIWASAGYSFL